MAQQETFPFGLICFAIFVYTKASTCIDDEGNVHQVGDVWKPSSTLTCTCTGPAQIACQIALQPPPIISVFPCTDNRGNTRKPGDVWLEDPTNKCTCTTNNLILCEILRKPVCLDASGKLRKNSETWLNGSCVECACVSGSINCTRYGVNVTHGLYEVTTSPTCELCDIQSQTTLDISACQAFRDHRAMLTECSLRGVYIRETHRCNGIEECPDGSDEKNCENITCKDEEGGTLVIKRADGWKVSRCLSCHCIGGLVTCKRTLTVNFPAYFYAAYEYEESCQQPSCKVLEFVRKNGKVCEAAELIKDQGIIFEGQSWKSNECKFYFPGSRAFRTCPVMNRPVCYIYNGYICCASHCPGLQQVTTQMRGNLTLCTNGRQVESLTSNCKDANNCPQNINIQNCSSEVTCQDEDGNQFFEGATWSVGACMQCACANGKIQCSRQVVFVKFLHLTPLEKQPRGKVTVTEKCYQPECNVARFVEKNGGVCYSCSWNGRLYFEGDHWKENSVDFYCSDTDQSQRVRPGCYVEKRRIKCTGEIPGIRQLSLISNDELFLCDSGDEIRSISDRCNIRGNCDDSSDERNCDNYYCPYEIAHGFLWNRTQAGQQVLKQCSLVDPAWTGTFGSNCTKEIFKTLWKHNTTCYCENKTLLEYFKEKIAGINSTNFLNVSEELGRSGKAKEFTNPRVFHDLYKELFYIITSRYLAPLTHQNADSALQYCWSVIHNSIDSPQYSVNDMFCKAKLAYDRNFLAEEALKFLRLAPNDTEAFRVGSTLQIQYVQDEHERFPSVTDNFKPPVQILTIQRQQLILQLNTAPLLRAAVENPTEIYITRANNASRKNNTNSNETRTTRNNVTTDLTTKQIKDLLRKNNCTKVEFDEEKGVFVFSGGVSTEYLKHDNIRSDMEIVLLCISTAAIILALIFLTVLRLKNSERLFIHKSLLFSVGIANIVFVMDKTLFSTREEHTALCSAVALVQHYFQTALFTWMLVEGINLYIKLVKVFSVKKQYALYLTIGWGIPAVIVGLVAAIRPSSFDMTAITTEVTCGALKLDVEVQRPRCWINGSLWIYKGPILAILLINFALFGILLRVIFGKISSRYGNNRVTIAKKGLRSIIALLPLLGVTWLFGFFTEFHYAVAYLFVLLSSTQGVVFCIFHCVLDDQVQDALRKLKVKQGINSRTGETPASNPNTTPVLERNSRVNMLKHSVDESSIKDGMMSDETEEKETSF